MARNEENGMKKTPDASHDSIFREFFAACPQWLDEVKYFPIPGKDEPQMCLSSPAMLAFLAWVETHTTLVVGRPHLLELLRQHINQMEEERRQEKD
jgi:hypothetical protein